MALSFLSTPRSILGNVSPKELVSRVFHSRASQNQANQTLAHELDHLEKDLQPDKLTVQPGSVRVESVDRETLWPTALIKGTLLLPDGGTLGIVAEKVSGHGTTRSAKLIYTARDGKQTDLLWKARSLWWRPRLENRSPGSATHSTATAEITQRGKALLEALIKKIAPNWFSN